ncbi:MAG: hypothetical protein QM747_09750 [Nocardioides sp.]
MSRLAMLSLAAAIITTTTFAADPLWIEGESAATQSKSFNIAQGPAFSGGKMLRFYANANAIAKDGDIATWNLTVAGRAGEHEFWARLGYRPWSDFQWRFDDGQWQTSSKSAGFFEFVKLPVNEGGVTEACWASLGKVKLQPGEHTLQVRLSAASNQNYVLQSFDCFVLSTSPFTPAGQYKPGDAPRSIRPAQPT